MLIRIAQVVIGLTVVSGVLLLAFTVSFRTKFPPVQNAIRRLNRRVLNPRQMRTAGQAGAWASVVTTLVAPAARATGRRSWRCRPRTGS